jgi:hypothetical protein
MTQSQAMLLAVGTFVLGLAVCVAIFLALDVKLLFLVGPAIGVGYASYVAYRSALDDGPA